MNVHSGKARVSLKLDLHPDAFADRRTAILDAGERCFVTHGIHRTTMQDLAKLAGMSVGNLYRYFPSKDAFVLALAERDRAEAGQHLCHGDEAPWPTLVSLLRKHLVLAPREKAMLLVELWAEGTRNPTISAMLQRFDTENRAWVAEVLGNSGSLSAEDLAELTDRVCTESQGIVVSRAVTPDYDPEPAAERLIAFVASRIEPRDRAPKPKLSRLESA